MIVPDLNLNKLDYVVKQIVKPAFNYSNDAFYNFIQKRTTCAESLVSGNNYFVTKIELIESACLQSCHFYFSASS